MQNRLIITGIPPTVPRLPNAAEALRDLIEEHGCWVDRFAFLLPSTDKDEDDSTMITAAAELHIENVRDDAIHLLNGLKVVLDMSGSVRSTTKHGGTLSNTSCDLHHSTNGICFTIGAAPITPFQSKLLIEQCPIHRDDLENATAMEKQTLVLPLGDMQLTVRSSIENGGGTGSTPWRGGLLLSHQICHWYKDRGDKTRNNFDSLFRNKTVLELGAGCSGLPSMTLAKLARTFSFDVTLISSDGIDEIVDSLQSNVRTNGLDEYITVKRIDWNDYCNDVDGRDEKLKANLNQADTILFADCIYNEKCAIALSETILRLIKPGGSVIGVLPDNRVGLDIFERCMNQHSFHSETLPVILDSNEPGKSFTCTGGGGKNYCMTLYRLVSVDDQSM